MALKSEFRVGVHSTTGELMFEVWYRGQFVASLYPADGAGLRVVSKHRMAVDGSDAPRDGIGVVTVRIG